MNANSWIINATAQDLPQLAERSQQVPVVIDFWADWCGPCKQLSPILEKVVNAFQGKVILAKVNADTEQELAAQFGIRSLPTLKLLYQGQLASELNGLQNEAALRDWLAPFADPEAAEAQQLDAMLQQLKMAHAQGQAEQAEAAIEQLLTEKPDAHAARALLIDWQLAAGKVDEARSLLAAVVEEVPELAPYQARIELLDKLDDSGDLSQLADAIQADDAAPDLLYQYGMQAAAAGEFRNGLDALLRLLRDHRDYKEGVAKAALLEIFDCLPKGDPLASEYRRKMFNFLH